MTMAPSFGRPARGRAQARAIGFCALAGTICRLGALPTVDSEANGAGLGQSPRPPHRGGTRGTSTAGGNITRVMLIPHSHEDPGWTQTIDEYYTGYDKYHYGVRPLSLAASRALPGSET